MPADAPSALELHGIEKVFRVGWRRRRAALCGVSLRLAAGEIVGLLGPNGAGKTTLVKIALGLLRPSAGGGRLLGRPLGDRRARRAVGYQPEQPYLYPFLTVRETLAFLVELAGVARAARPRRIEVVVTQCGLAPVWNEPVRRLSRGWRQRLALGGALLCAPRLLLLDEPLGGLDPEARLEIKTLLAQLRADGVAILINSHLLLDLEQLVDRVALLRAGRIVACGALEELLRPSRGGCELDLRLPPGASPLPLPGNVLWEDRARGRARWWLPEMPAEDRRRVLSGLLAAGVVIEGLRPQRERLEEFFARVMRVSREEGSPVQSERVAG